VNINKLNNMLSNKGRKHLMTQNVTNMIDHTLLKADATKEEIMKLVEEAKKYLFASVCVNPTWVKISADMLKDTPEVKVCTVIGFPLGASTPETKAFETKNAIENGANEIDMVINIAALKDKQDDLVERDIKAVVEAAQGKALTKVIIETCLLTNEEKVRACEISVKAGADFVKTSTGFSTGGATVEDIKLMRETVGPEIGVKASGGVRSREDALAMIEAGATRIGASSGVSISKGELSLGNY
jgi:deoxyribose-phosphate aldolase